MTKKTKADLALIGVTVGWGASFLFTKEAINQIEVFNFIALRFFIAFAFSFVIFYKRMIKANLKGLLYGGILGTILFVSYGVQTLGLQYTSVSNSAFITGLSVVLVPIILSLLDKRLPSPKLMLCSMVAASGLALLTLSNGLNSINIGDILTLISALGFATHIIVVGKLASKEDPFVMAIIQFGVVTVLSTLISVGIETPVLPTTSSLWLNIVGLSIVCTAGAFITQNVAQKYTTASHTALIYTLEPVFAAVAGYIFVGEVLSGSGLMGASLIVTGMLISEIDFASIFNIRRKQPARI